MQLFQNGRLLGLFAINLASILLAQASYISSTLLRPSNATIHPRDLPKFLKVDLVVANCRPFIDIYVGSDPTPFNVMADTSATGTWVASKKNPSDPGSNPPFLSGGVEMPTHQYERSSGGFVYQKFEGRKRKVIYGYGIAMEVRGVFVNAPLRIGSVTAAKAAIGFAETTKGMEEWGFYDDEGRFGLGMSRAEIQPALFDVLLAMHPGTQCQFSLDYVDYSSSFTLGEDPEALATPDNIPMMDLRQSLEGWWKATVKIGVFSGERRLEEKFMVMVFLTTSQFITMDPLVVTGYYSRLGKGAARLTTNQYGHPIWLVRCGAALPDLVFKLQGRSGQQVRISGRRLYLRLINSGECRFFILVISLVFPHSKRQPQMSDCDRRDRADNSMAQGVRVLCSPIRT